jgi:hypothetical protein
LRFGSRETEETACLVEHISEFDKPTDFSNDVEKITVLTGSGIRPLARGASARAGSSQAKEEALARCVPDVTDEPVAALPTSVRQIMTADGLGVLGQPS